MKDLYFLSGRISSLEKKFITYEKLKKIIDSKTFEEFINLLEDTFFKLPSHITSSEEIFKYFENERSRLVEEIEKTFNGNLKLFFLLKYDYFNLANLILGKEIFSLYGTINFYTLKDAFEKNDKSKVPEILHNGFKIGRSEKPVEKKLLLLKIDYYKKLYQIAEKISDFVKNYVKIEIDFSNLETYLNKKMFGEKLETIDLIENGNIEKESFLDEENLWKKVGSIYRKIEIPLNEENIEIEKYGRVVNYIKESRIKPDTIDKIVSFYIAREIEIDNLQRIVISKFYKMSEEFFKKILIPPYQYREEK
ncbi:MAG: V-type ATPase subunit [Candidatus Omnitrophica bacterium]|nr:V-type ATPase subunit [Candidatus Omnitrophota bacterium]